MQEIELSGTTLAKCKLVNDNGQILHRVCVLPVKCIGKKEIIIDYVEIYPIDNSMIDWKDEDVKPLHEDEYYIIKKNEFEITSDLEIFEDVEKFINQKKPKDFRIEKIEKIYEIDLDEE